MDHVKRFIKREFPGWVSSYHFLSGFRKGREILRLMEKREPFTPRIVYVETTNVCNAKCIMCPHKKMSRGEGTMSWDLFRKIIDNCKRFEGEGLSIFLHKDGEPLLDPLLFQRAIYTKASLPQSKVHLNSNASLLDEEKSKQLLDCGVDYVTFSVDGASEKAYEKIRAGLSYRRTKANLDRFFDLKRKSPSKIRVTLQMVVCEDNESEVDAYRRQWSGKAEGVVFKSMHNFLDMGTSAKTKQLEGRQLRFCVQPFEQLLIYWNGDIGLCCWDYDHLCNLGSIENGEIMEVYNNEEFRKVRIAMARMDCSQIDPCRRCSQIYGQDMDMDYVPRPPRRAALQPGDEGVKEPPVSSS